MKEIFVIKTSEEDFIKQCRNKIISVPIDTIYRASLYAACIDSQTLKLQYLTRIEAVKLNEENNADSKENISTYSYCLYIKPSKLIKLAVPIDFSPCADNLPQFLNFDDILGSAAESIQSLKNKKKLSKKEVSLIVTRYLEQGISFSVSQKLEDAYNLFDRALDIDENNYLIYFYLGNIYVDRATIELAIYYYRKSIEINPRFHHAFNYLGLAYMYLNKIHNAVECWEQSLNLNSKDEFALTNLGKALIQQKKYAKALEILTMAKDINSTNLFIYNLIGVANANLGRLDDAIESWAKIIEAGQDDEYLHLNLARAYFESQRYREALEEYEILLDMFPAGHDLHKLAEQNIEVLREKVTEKTVVINSVKDISPYFIQKFGIALPNIDDDLSKKINFNKLADYILMFDLSSYKIKAIIFDKDKEDDSLIYDDASQIITFGRDAYKTTIKLRKSLKKIKTIAPLKDKNDEVKNTSEEDAKDMDKEKEKEKEQIKIRQIQTQNESSRISSEEIQNALEQAQALVSMEPNNEWAHYSLGSILAQIGSFKDAADEFSKASTINSNNAIAWYALGLCHVRMNQLDEAVQALQQAIISVPDSRLTSVYEEWNYKDSLAYFGLGDVYIRKGMFDEAIKIFKKGLLIDATSALAHFQLGTCYEVKEQYDEAIESLLNSLSLNPNFAYAYSKLGIIYFRKELYNEAQVMLLKAVGYENPDSESFYFLGEVYLKLAKPEDAKYCFANILQTAAKDDMYYEKAAKKLEELGNKR